MHSRPLVAQSFRALVLITNNPFRSIFHLTLLTEPSHPTMFDQTPQPSQAKDPQSLSHFVLTSQSAPGLHNQPPSMAPISPTPQGMKNVQQGQFDPALPRMNTTTVPPAIPPTTGVAAVQKRPLGPPQVRPPSLKKSASTGTGTGAGAATAGASKGDLVLSLSFVGMKYRGRHVFSSSDIIVLQNDDKNPYDKNAIKVMLKKTGGKWKHVAYVAGDDAKRLRECSSEVRPDRACLKFVSNSYTKDTAYYRMTIPRK